MQRLEPALERVWRREHETPLKNLVKGALRAILRQAHEGPVDLEAVRSALDVPSLIENRPQYLPEYALA
jgi:hypothetical protein